MKFKESLKHVQVGERVGRLQRTDRFYACHCGTITGWRVDLGSDFPDAIVCSDECLDVLDGVNPEPPEKGPT